GSELLQLLWLHLEQQRLKGSRDVVLIRDLTAQRGLATRKAADAAGRGNRRRAALGRRAPRRSARRRRRARFAPRSRSRAPRRGRDRSRLSAAGQSDDREGGLRAPTEPFPGRVLLIEVAANQPMCMHHELSCVLEFPCLMLFACLIAPTDGGATPVADSSTVLHA